jgi:hypothetical protein
MAVQLSVTARNARLDSVETTVGAAPLLRLFVGNQPNDCSLADSGTKLAEITLPSDWLNDAANGAKTIKGSWASTGLAAGNIGHFRIKDSTGTTCHIQGLVTASGQGGDLTVDNINVAIGQNVSVTSFTLTDGNA